MHPSATRVALLLFGSGFCALVYQVAWLRLLRLIFGASTAATAAVLAVFMAGLGLGSLILGRRADSKPRPLVFYAHLEAGVAVAAALSPWLVTLARQLYFGSGGTAGLGPSAATALQLLLAALVLGIPTFLMGGTLPAAARAVEQVSDAGRRSVALLYGANTAGAVCGALVTTFFALELLGIRKTVWAASLLNLLVALAAYALAGSTRERRAVGPARPAADRGGEPAAAPGPVGVILGAATAAGFAFLLLELVWYRMLAPVLGGSSYTFGLILAMALLGVGAGGFLYAAGARHRRPTLLGLSGVCAAEALCVLLPYALGDRIAVVAMLLRPVGDLSFALLAVVWSVLAGLVVVPAAILAGYQFPLLIALLGTGRQRVGREVGLVYACNTAGAILGSVAGGFGLIALLSAPAAWVLAAVLLLAVAGVVAAVALRAGAPLGRAGWPAAAAAGSLLLLSAAGPSAVWRHTPTGAGGMPSSFYGVNDLRKMAHTVRRAIVWERDGRESSVAIHGLDEISFLLNGKSDGSAVKDAPTQVMSGLIGAALHPDPRRALVIGLGTGSSAGWLAEVESVEQVDVVELEPAIVEIARYCAAVNHDVLAHPKVRVMIGDGREMLLTGRGSYDLIFSEPSNPYRAGIASLFTREFYAAAAGRLGDRGLFLQWLQGYHLDSQVVRTVLATLGAVFANVEVWQVHTDDLLLVAGRRPIVHDLERLRKRAAREPLRSAMADVLGVSGVEGFYSGFVAEPAFAASVREAEGDRLNTDDHPIVEFGFARGVGRNLEFSVERLASLARMRGESWPRTRGGTLDRRRVLEAVSARNAMWGVATSYPVSGDAGFDLRVRARNAFVDGDLARARSYWLAQNEDSPHPIDRMLVAESLAEAADPRSLAYASGLEAAGRRVAAGAVRARFHLRRGELQVAARHLVATFRGARDDPWVFRPVLQRAFGLALELARGDSAISSELFAALAEPFAVRLFDELRLRARLEVAQSTDFEDLCGEALAPFEPHVPWEQGFLTLRHQCYQASGQVLERRARADLDSFLANAPSRLRITSGERVGDGSRNQTSSQNR
ncbi:MAG: fused MFS/spermidine synthase [Thermoanaerobaculia bacterium]